MRPSGSEGLHRLVVLFVFPALFGSLFALFDALPGMNLDRTRGVQFAVGSQDRQGAVEGQCDGPSALVDQVVMVWTGWQQVFEVCEPAVSPFA